MKKIIKEKSYCPICGSTRIRQAGKRYVCLDCRAMFMMPRKTQIKLPKKPKYIG
jgi:transposase-like protein